jgi:hypothetical protein
LRAISTRAQITAAADARDRGFGLRAIASDDLRVGSSAFGPTPGFYGVTKWPARNAAPPVSGDIRRRS